MGDDSEEVFLQCVCEANGIHEGDVTDGAPRVSSLEMFDFNLPRTVVLRRFSYLRELTVMRQEVSVIEGLDNCGLLETLWMSENCIERIEGLQGCPHLRKLYLHSNQIARIENLAHLSDLEVLWLCDNHIRVVEGLDSLVALKQLWLARNDITTLGDGLSALTALEDLNLADNNIGWLKDVIRLSSLPRLRSLAFSEPHYGDSPVCRLYNYQTFVLCHMKHLTSLDSLRVLPDARRMASTTLLKKKLFYNMQMKAWQRTVWTQLSRCRLTVTERLRGVMQAYQPLQRGIREEEKISTSPESGVVSMEDKEAVERYKTMKETMYAIFEDIHNVTRAFDALYTRMASISFTRIRHMFMEMESAGNIRFEEVDPAMTVCNQALGDLDTVRLLGGLRVHNRFLQTRFDECVGLEEGHEEDEENRRIKDFWLYRVEEEGEMERVMEEGPCWDDTMNPILCDTLAEADHVQACGCVLVCRVHLAEDKVVQVADELAVLEAFRQSPPPDAVSWRDEQKHTFLRVRNAASILPEFIFFYTRENVPTTTHTSLDVYTALLESLSSMFLNSPLMSSAPTRELKDRIRQALPQLKPPMDRSFSMTPRALQETAQVSKLSVLTYLNLTGLHIKRINGLQSASSLRVLILCCNEIQKVEGLAHLSSLETLDLSVNVIRGIEGLENLHNLRCLDLSNNAISLLEDVTRLSRNPALTHLKLFGNSVSFTFFYRPFVWSVIPSLRELDGHVVSEDDEAWSAALRPFPSLEDMWKHAFRKMRPGWGIYVPYLLGGEGAYAIHGNDQCDRIRDLNLDGLGILRLQEVQRFTGLRRLCVRFNQLTTLEDLSSLVTLEELFAENNCLTSLRGIETMTRLTRLDADCNKLTVLPDLCPLELLSQLSLCDNELSSLTGIASASSLMELYISGNSITDVRELLILRGLERLTILDAMENPFSGCEEDRIYVIFHLPRLKVVSGRSVTEKEREKAREAFSITLSSDRLIAKLGTRDFSTVTELNLASMKLQNVCGLEDVAFGNLRSLNLENNQLAHVHALKHLIALETLILRNNHIESLSPFPDANPEEPLPWSLLGTLDLSFNGIVHMEGLRLWCFTRLQTLSLRGNEIQRVEGLNGLINLSALHLDANKIRDIDEMAIQHTSLRMLTLSDNPLRSIALDPLPRLESLNLTNTRVAELSDLDRLLQLPNLVDLRLNDTPLARRSLHRATLLHRFATLTSLDGKDITPEERERVEVMFDPERSSGQVERGRVALRLSSVQVGIGSELSIPSFMDPLGPTPSVSGVLYANRNASIGSSPGGDFYGASSRGRVRGRAQNRAPVSKPPYAPRSRGRDLP